MENIISLTQKNGSEDVTTSNFKYYSYYDITLNIIYLVWYFDAGILIFLEYR